MASAPTACPNTSRGNRGPRPGTSGNADCGNCCTRSGCARTSRSVRRVRRAPRCGSSRLPTGGARAKPTQGLGRDPDHDRRRSQAPRRPHRYHLGSPYLGLSAHPSSARPHDRAGRRHLARRRALGGVLLARSAMVEAATQLQKGLVALERLSEAPRHMQQELDLRMALGTALIATRASEAVHLRAVPFSMNETGIAV